MKCPHCNADLLHKQRGGRRCSKCRETFAFEPKGHALKLHDLRFQRVVTRLSQNGTLMYTAAQLHHALGRKVVPTKKPNRWFSGLGCTLLASIVFGGMGGLIIASQITLLSENTLIFLCALMVFGIGVVLTALNALRPFRPTLPMRPEQFQRDVIERWQTIYGGLPGLIHPQQPWPPDPPPARQRAVLACSQRDVVRCLRSNRVPERLELGVLSLAEARTAAEEATLAQLQANPQMPLLVLHDASPDGCILAQQLPLMLGLQPHQRIIDLGIAPRHALKHNLLRLGVKPAPELLHILRKRVVPPRGATTAGTLTQAEFDWLAKGFYSPLLAVPPARLIEIVTRAAAQAAPKRSLAPVRRDNAEKQAQAVGFMTWPTER